MKLWVEGENVMHGFTGDGIEHVSDVEEEQGVFGIMLELK
jgi:hypothetical protein